MRGGLIAIPLGEALHAELEAALETQFGPSEVVWLERADLRRRPLQVLARLTRRHYADAVLVVPDLRQSRLRWTSLVLGLPRAETRWRIDLHGNREAFSLTRHLAHNLPGMIRHLVACGLALVFGAPLLRLAANTMVRPRTQAMSRPTRLLYLRSQLWLGLEGGGSVAHTAGVIGGVEAAGVDVQVVSSDRLAGVEAQTDVVAPEMWFDGLLRDAEDIAYNVAFFAAALRSARRARPQAIYQRHTAFNVAGALLSRTLGLPLVLEFNSSEVWKGRHWGGLHLERAAAAVERINLHAADRVVVVSAALADQVRAAGVPADKILVNPNAVNPYQFRPDVDGTGIRRSLGFDSSIVVGFSGTFGVWHGVPTLAAALPRVLHARRHVRWLLMGDGPLRRLVDEAVKEHGLGDRVRSTGLVPHVDMPYYLAACDVLVSPHGRQVDGGEFFGSPTKLFEYMAAGRPIVASEVGQIAEVLHDEESALLVPPDDPEALCRAILRLVDDAALRSRLAHAAREKTLKEHTWRQNAERLLASLASLDRA